MHPMRIRSKQAFKTQKAGLVTVIMVPVVLLGSILGLAAYTYSAIPSFGMDDSLELQLSEFTPGNYTDLALVAAYLDQRFEDFHMPLNYTVPTLFTNDSRTVVERYIFTDNGALWSATAMAAFVGKYLAAIRENDTVMKEDALRVIRRLTHGMAMMLAVPNGGLGPEHGAIVARMWAAPEHASVPGMPLFGNQVNVSRPRPYAYYNGTGPYSQWRYSDFTSLDEYGGYYMGIALPFKFISPDDAPDVHETLRLIIDQLCTGMQQTNFLGIGGWGGPTGTDQKSRFFQGGCWALLVLKMGALAFPDKYERLYYHYAVEQGYAFHTREGGPQEIVANYYAYNFAIDVTFALLVLEDDPVLRGVYLKNFRDGMWSYVKWHRNAHFNVIHLIVNRFAPGQVEYYERDVEDQLMDFKVSHVPDVVGPLVAPDASYQLVDFSTWTWFFTFHPVGNALAPLFFEFELDKGFFNKPLKVSMMPTRSYIWGGNPFRGVDEGYTPDLRVEQAGLSFLMPYWLARGFGFINASGVRSP